MTMCGNSEWVIAALTCRFKNWICKGDLFFSVVNYARFLKIDPDQALARTNHKFMKRFQEMEKVVVATGKKMTDMSLEEMDEIWNEVKKLEA